MLFNANKCHIVADTKFITNHTEYPRITTMLVGLPRSVWSEFMTHRVFSRNAQSSRAIPVKRVYEAVTLNPYVPTHWGKNQRGMQAFEEIDKDLQQEAKQIWLSARDNAVEAAKALDALGIHKQVTNRLLEPYQWHMGLVTSTMWNNFLTLRNHRDAEPNIQELAQRIQEELDNNTPVNRSFHLPFTDIFDQELVREYRNEFAMLSAAKCARLSYLTYDGQQSWEDDLKLAKKLLTSPLHASTIEHQAVTNSSLDYVVDIDAAKMAGNLFHPSYLLNQWIQFRKAFTHETTDSIEDWDGPSSVDPSFFNPSGSDQLLSLDDFFDQISTNLYKVLK